MITLDQVILLEQKVESAVAKIQQLQAENDALRAKCGELTNALSSKTELLSTIESDQSQIESGIKKALDRLLYIENAVLKNGGSAADAQAASHSQPEPSSQAMNPAEDAEVEERTNPAAGQENPAQNQDKIEQIEQIEQIGQIEQPVSYVQYNHPHQEEPDPSEPNFGTIQLSDTQEIENAFDDGLGDDNDDEAQDNLGFDIF